MPVYTITVNGRTYEVEVEKKGDTPGPKMNISVPKVAPVSAPPSVLAAPTSVSPVADGAGNKITAPMPGKVIDIKVTVGDSVKKGQELVIMEAMKMNNPVLAVHDGVVKEIYVKKGDPVQTGTGLIFIG